MSEVFPWPKLIYNRHMRKDVCDPCDKLYLRDVAPFYYEMLEKPLAVRQERYSSEEMNDCDRFEETLSEEDKVYYRSLR